MSAKNLWIVGLATCFGFQANLAHAFWYNADMFHYPKVDELPRVCTDESYRRYVEFSIIGPRAPVCEQYQEMLDAKDSLCGERGQGRGETIDYYAAVDSRYVPPTYHWLSELKSNYPFFQSAELHCQKKYHFSSPEEERLLADNPYNFFATILKNDRKNYDTVHLAPKNLRVRIRDDGSPAIDVSKGLFSSFYKVNVEFELGLFGDDYADLEEVFKRYSVSYYFAHIRHVKIFPLDPAWNPVSGVVENSSTSLYSDFKQVDEGRTYVSAKDAPTGHGMTMWSGKVAFTTSRDGTKLLQTLLKEGLFNFPVIARFDVRLATFPDRKMSTEYGQVPVDIKNVPMTVPGGLACLNNTFWGSTQTAAANGCDSYWVN